MSTVFITGANRGIGLELARIFAGRGDEVIAGVRRSSPELEATGARVETVDVADDDSVAALAERLDDGLDLLLHNAGVLQRVTLDELDLEAVRRQFEVNALGPVKLTAALRHRLNDGGKVAIVTSRMGSIADNTSGSHYGYRMSKAAVNTAGVSLAHDLRPRKIAVALLHPGYVRTGMTGGRGNWDPDAAAAALVERIDELSLETSGTFWHAEGQVLPW